MDRRRLYRTGWVAASLILLTTMVWVWNTNLASAHGSSGRRCSGGYHHHSSNPHKCHKHCRNAQSGRHDGLSLHGENCARNTPTPRPTRRPTRTPRPPPATPTRRPPPATPTRRPPPATPTPRPTPAATPVPSTPGANFGRGDCDCTGGSLDRLRTTGIDWLDTAAFNTYAAKVCAQTSGPYFEARDFVTGWVVDPPHPTLHSQAVLSQSPGTSRYAIVASATAPRKAECTAANVSAGEVPDVADATLDCTGAQAHLSGKARAWIAGGLQRSYPGSAVRGNRPTLHRHGQQLAQPLRADRRRPGQSGRLRDDRARLLRTGLPPDRRRRRHPGGRHHDPGRRQPVGAIGLSHRHSPPGKPLRAPPARGLHRGPGGPGSRCARRPGPGRGDRRRPS